MKLYQLKNTKYLKHSQLAIYRKREASGKCPLLGVHSVKPCVDHNHSTGMVRGVVSMEGNTLLGRFENSFKRFGSSTNLSLSDVLRNCADYLDSGDKDLLHPVGLKQICSRFSRQTLDNQILALNEIKVKKTEIKACNNSSERTALYRRSIIDNTKTYK